jgi:fructokinase
LWDLFPDGPRLGGALANVAYHAAKLGAEAVLVSRVGRDELGERARAELSRHGVNVEHVQVDDEKPTGTVRVETESGEPRYSIATEAAWDGIVSTDEINRLMSRADAVCYGTLAQRTPLASAELVRALAATRTDAIRLCDLNLRPPHVRREVVVDSIRRATAVKLNAVEAERVAEAAGVDDAIGFLFRDTGVSHVAITLGERGAELFLRDQKLVEPALPIDESSGDRVGAGDAFVAALAVGLASGAPPEVILKRAIRYSAFVASKPGGMPPIPHSLVTEMS